MTLVARFGFLFIAIGLPSLFDTIVKRLIGRARPYIGPRDNPFAYKPFVWSPEYASMPSGHATTAAAAAIAIGAIWPRCPHTKNWVDKRHLGGEILETFGNVSKTASYCPVLPVSPPARSREHRTGDRHPDQCC